MIFSYLKIAFRNLSKNKAHTFINIAGLAIGLTCSLFMLLWVQSELSVDAYHVNNSRLYRVYEREYLDHKITADYETPGVMADELKRIMPEVQYAAAMQESNNIHTFKAANKTIKLEGTYAGADLFKMFTYPLLAGTPQSALSTPVSIAISQKMANVLFGGVEQAMGQALRFDNSESFVVTAVFANVPQNSSRRFEYVINWQAYLATHPGQKQWDNSGPATYVMLKPNASAQQVGKKLRRLASHYRVENAAFHSEHGLQPYGDVYLHSNFVNGNIEGGRIAYVHLFSIAAIFLLLIACVNFMNLATAQSVKRSREIGVRKVLGAVRGTLIKQFIGESLLFTVLAVAVALFLITLFLPAFNQITQKQITIPFNSAGFWLKILLLILLTGFISGSYPALFLSSFNPVKVLKGTSKINTGAVWFRKGLVVFQFVLSGILIIATIVVSRQVRYIQTLNLGYDRDNLIYIPVEGALNAKYDLFKTAALNMPGVASVSNISTTPTFIDDATTSIDWDGKQPGTKVSFAIAAIGYDFASAMKLQMLQGRDYSKAYPADANNYIINEAAGQKLGYTNAVGKTINMWGVKGNIIGVVKNFHFASLHNEIKPLVLRLSPGILDGGYLLVRIKPGHTGNVLASLQTLCKQINPEFPFTYYFSDEQYQQLYKSEQVVVKLSNVFSALAIFVSCLGLLGLAMFTAQQRVKEIGIRKVLGASVASLFGLLSAEFLLLVVLALLIASPIAWYAMHRWLQAYAYHTPLQWWVFALSGGSIMLIALATVSFQTVKTSLINPVKTLRNE
ncbi:FtsX-like permease family protein [Mucilaginibacter gracilis]|uniref:FtsX-like permease family protein n=1 Tax=Mucilaginibacter gracilis TaxID=423350 RepID=A0A495JA37_9SPHI|nr:ABC transporter permease [Mucilaginibacter gracilis]RKR84929.1 FtsX-like permease family protein [Mucilaginibacter gracilis]